MFVGMTIGTMRMNHQYKGQRRQMRRARVRQGRSRAASERILRSMSDRIGVLPCTQTLRYYLSHTRFENH